MTTIDTVLKTAESKFELYGKYPRFVLMNEHLYQSFRVQQGKNDMLMYRDVNEKPDSLNGMLIVICPHLESNQFEFGYGVKR